MLTRKMVMQSAASALLLMAAGGCTTATLAAKDASKIGGVIRVDNWIKVKPQAASEAVSRKIEEAFKRQADLEAEKIRVRAEGGKVVLEGSVSSWTKRSIAEEAAWSAPGVSQIEDHLVVN